MSSLAKNKKCFQKWENAEGPDHFGSEKEIHYKLFTSIKDPALEVLDVSAAVPRNSLV